MAKVSKKSDVVKERAATKALAPIMVGSFDTTVNDVIKYIDEGRDLFFKDDKDSFLTLPEDVVKTMLLEHKTRYRVAKGIVEGKYNLIDEATTSTVVAQALDYNKRLMPVGEQTKVFGKKEDREYYWERAERVHTRELEGWVVDHDTDVKTVVNDGTRKFIGGANKPEMVLMNIGKEHLSAQKTKKREVRENMLKSAADRYKKM